MTFLEIAFAPSEVQSKVIPSMAFNFDSCPERAGTDSTKWHKYAQRDIIPSWIADMDFVSPPAVVEAMQARAAHGVYGYPAQRDEVFNSIVKYMLRRHGWKIQPEWITFMTSLVPGIHGAIRCTTNPGETVVTTTPAYPPFLTAPTISERTSIKLEMVLVDDYWTFDWEKLESACSQSASKILLLCNPYNPLARVFNRSELERIAAIVKKHNLVVCSDEIHCDLILDPAAKHTVFAALNEDTAARTVTLMGEETTLVGMSGGAPPASSTSASASSSDAMALNLKAAAQGQYSSKGGGSLRTCCKRAETYRVTEKDFNFDARTEI
jgi:cystathionine beta-lyase